jgi:SAM-dependent methyltransferase
VSRREAARRLSGPERLEALLRYHQTLLADAVRNRAFARALARVVRPGADVLDLGAGTGLWAVVAARLGARRVVAVEKEPLLAPLIARLARENGVEGAVVVAEGDSRTLELGREFDVVVSETVGTEGFDEGIVALLADARRRFLRRGGVLVPRALSLCAAPAENPVPAGLRPRLLSDACFRELAVHAPNAVPTHDVHLLGRASRLVRIELGRPGPAPLQRLRASFRVSDGRRLGCFAVWPELELAPGVRLSTRAAQAWGLAYLPVEPGGRGACSGEIEISLAPRRRWRLTLRQAGRGTRVRDYDPLLAWGALSAARR